MSAAAVVLIAVGVVVLAFAGALVIGGPGFRERTADLANEFWDWLRLGR
jgi:hypothetical protein